MPTYGSERYPGKNIVPPKQSLRKDMTNGEPRMSRTTGRRSISPGGSGEKTLPIGCRKRQPGAGNVPPPPYGVGMTLGVPNGRTHSGQGSKRYENSKLFGEALDLSDVVCSPPIRDPSPSRRVLAPQDNVPRLWGVYSDPPTDFRPRMLSRSRSCPPPDAKELPIKKIIPSPQKNKSHITTNGGCIAGVSPPDRPGIHVHATQKHLQNFLITSQNHAAATSMRLRPRSLSPGRPYLDRYDDAPHYISKRSFQTPVFRGSGTADAMNWTKPQRFSFSKKRQPHISSDNVYNAMSGRGNAEAPRGRNRGVISQQITFNSKPITCPSLLPHPAKSPSKRSVSNATFSHTALW